MAQLHLYGPNYSELTPPLEWQGLQLKATINDDSVEANIDTSVFTFVGDAADYMKNEFIPAYGVFNGCPYRIVIQENGLTTIAFDGFIMLNTMEINSKIAPNMFKAEVRSLNNNITIFDKISVLTQGLLRTQGFITTADFVDVPVVKVSKKNANDRIVALSSLGYQVVSTFLSWIQDFLSAISDIIGLSAAVGLVELATLFINIIIQIQQLVDLIFANRDLLLASQVYYKGISLKTVVEKAFSKYNHSVEWGIIEDFISKIYLLGSNNGFFGNIMTGMPGEGILKTPDYGYLISECMEMIKKLCHTREDVVGNVAHIKTKTDPYWNQAPAYTPEPILVEQTKQYQNGIYSNDTDNVFATTRITYQYDAADAWTLTENNGDAHEVHLELINEIDPRMNLLKGLRDIQINAAMAVRYDPVDTLTDIMNDALGGFGNFLGQFQGLLNNFAGYIDTSNGGGSELGQILQMTGLNLVFALKPGGLKVEDDTWGIPKIIYANKSGNVLNIPANFKDYIGARALYQNYYFPDSPSQENGFKGQYTLIKGWNIPFSLSNFAQTFANPHFYLNTTKAKFKYINWTIDGRKAETEVEVNEPFDKNIREIEI